MVESLSLSLKLLHFLLLLLVSPILARAIPADTVRLREHLVFLTQKAGYRTHKNLPGLNASAAYIDSVLRLYSDSVSRQAFVVNGRTYQNVIASFGPKEGKRIVIGAHYDVCDSQAGADDNASGVAGMLELARMFRAIPPKMRVDLVAYTLEEPPYFRTRNMGSAVHARWLKQTGTPVAGMISLEMIGYFDDRKRSQDYPVGILRWVYGSRGNYITLVRKFGAGRFARRFCRIYKRGALIRTKRFKAPAFLPGIDFSDHLNYWAEGFSALMITDTAFFRNKNYHQPTDTLETLDLRRMALVIESVQIAVEGM